MIWIDYKSLIPRLASLRALAIVYLYFRRLLSLFDQFLFWILPALATAISTGETLRGRIASIAMFWHCFEILAIVTKILAIVEKLSSWQENIYSGFGGLRTSD